MTETQAKLAIAFVLGIVAVALTAAPVDPGLRPVVVAAAGLLTAIAFWLNPTTAARRLARR